MKRIIHLLCTIHIVFANIKTAITREDFSELCIRDNTYWLSLYKTNNTKAKEGCLDIGAELTLFSTNEEYFNVSSYLDHYWSNHSLNIDGIWVDLIANDTNRDGVYEHFWRNETFAKGVWFSKQPDTVCKGGNEECCARISWSNQTFSGLRDRPCDKGNYSFLCSVTSVGSIHRYKCSCESGNQTVVETVHCQDVNECLETPNPCQHICTNTNGSYICNCNPGYQLKDDNHTCSDMDECFETDVPCTQKCVNIVGSYVCSCNDGFTLSQDGLSCMDIDECVTPQHNCQQKCNNIIGNYTCECVKGFALATNGVSCDDADECNTGLSNCQHSCSNTEGSYTCSCNSGFTLSQDNSSCVNITEQRYPFNAKCACHCPDNLLDGTDPSTVKETADRIHAHLILKKQSLSSYKRSKISIPDSRSSFQAIGYLGLTLMATVFGWIIVLDVIRTLLYVTRMICPSRRPQKTLVYSQTIFAD